MRIGYDKTKEHRQISKQQQKTQDLNRQGTKEMQAQTIREMNTGRKTEQNQTGEQAVNIKQEVKWIETEKDSRNTRKAGKTKENQKEKP